MNTNDDDVIRAGDLVMVVRGQPCCGTITGHEGLIFRAELFEPHRDNFVCIHCGEKPSNAGWCKKDGKKYFPLGRLKKIKPDRSLMDEDEWADVPEVV